MNSTIRLCVVGILALAATAQAQPVRPIPLTAEPAAEVSSPEVRIGDITIKTESDRTVHLQLTMGRGTAVTALGDVRGQALFSVHLRVVTKLGR